MRQDRHCFFCGAQKRRKGCEPALRGGGDRWGKTKKSSIHKALPDGCRTLVVNGLYA